MNIRFIRLVQASLLCLDLLSLNLSVLVCQLWFNTPNGYYDQEYVQFWILLNLFWFVASWLGNVYSEANILSFEYFSRRTMKIYFYWLGLNMIYLFFAHQYTLSRLYIGVVLIGFGIMLILDRFMYLFIRAYLKSHNIMARKVMIIGYNDMAKKLVSYLEEDGMNTEVVGFCEETEKVKELSHYPIVDSIENTITASLNYKVNEIYSTIAPEQNEGIYKLMKDADQACIHFRLIPDLSYFVKRTFYIDYLKDIPVISLRQEPLNETGNRIRKRLFDILFSLFVILFILSWLVPILSLIILLESKGPVFFKQARTGRDGKVFYCVKFRSMRTNKDADTRQASKDDDRFTKVGRFLRKTNLDEFPQFINVLKGEMSVVGPRPHMVKHTHDYSKLIDQYMVRQFLKPGITGWAQVNGFRGETTTIQQMQGRVEHDIWYMENWGLWLDIRIVFITIYNMLMGEKNAF